MSCGLRAYAVALSTMAVIKTRMLDLISKPCDISFLHFRCWCQGAVPYCAPSTSMKRRRNSQIPSLHRRFPPARTHRFSRSDVAVPDDQRLVEIVHRRANMARQKIESLTDSRQRSAIRSQDRQVLFTGRERFQFGVPEDQAVGHSGIG